MKNLLFVRELFKDIDILILDHLVNTGGMIWFIFISLLSFICFIVIIIDMITGIIASMYEKRTITSRRLNDTPQKILGLFLYFLLASIFILSLNLFYVDIMLLIWILLLILKEYKSVGENIERRYGVKPYFFNIVDNLFSIIEVNFFKKLENFFDKFDKNKEE